MKTGRELLIACGYNPDGLSDEDMDRVLWYIAHNLTGERSAVEKLIDVLRQGHLQPAPKARKYFCSFCQEMVAGKKWDGTGYTKLLCEHCDGVLIDDYLGTFAIESGDN